MNEFLDFFDYLIANCKEPVEVPNHVQEVYTTLREQQKEKPLFTETGLQIMEYLQGQEVKGYKANEIAAGMGLSSRKVSGAMRKLVTDGFVEKLGANPVIYALTSKGKDFKGE